MTHVVLTAGLDLSRFKVQLLGQAYVVSNWMKDHQVQICVRSTYQPWIRMCKMVVPRHKVILIGVSDIERIIYSPPLYFLIPVHITSTFMNYS